MIQIADAILGRLVVIAPFMAVGYLIEQVCHRVEQRTSSVPFNLAATFIYSAVNVTLAAYLMGVGSELIQSLPGAGILRLPFSARPALFETLAAACLLAVLQDGCSYWMHRWQHRSAWLWAIHEIHHSDPHVNVTTTYRLHWLESVVLVIFYLPLAYVFAPTAQVGHLVALLFFATGHFIHLNAKIRLGRWSWVIANPQTHRIHHSIEPRHLDRNFAVVFPLWDLLFGTYHHPSAEEFPHTGVAGTAVPVRHVLTWPWHRWMALIRPASDQLADRA